MFSIFRRPVRISPAELEIRSRLTGCARDRLDEVLTSEPGPDQRTRLTAAMLEYLQSGWSTLGSKTRYQLGLLPERDRRIVAGVLVGADRSMQASVSRAGRAAGHPSLEDVMDNCARLGERLLAMHLGRESRQNVDRACLAMQELGADACWAAATKQRLLDSGAGPDALAPSFWAALVRYADPVSYPDTDAAWRVLLPGTTPSAHERALVEAGLADWRHVEQRVLPMLREAAQLGLEVAHPDEGLRRQLREKHADLSTAARSVLVQLTLEEKEGELRPAFSLNQLAKHLVPAYADSPVAWIEATAQLIDGVMTAGVAFERQRLIGAARTRAEYLRHRGVRQWLPQLAALGTSERALGGDAESRWREIEAELRRMDERRRDGDPPAIYLFPETMRELEGRALFYYNATQLGVPLGAFLHQLAHDPELTFGPTERRFFTRILFAGARRFASGLVADEDPRVQELEQAGDAREQVVRVAHVRTVLTRIERQLRRAPATRRPAALAEHLKAEGERLLREAVEQEDLRELEWRALTQPYPGFHDVGDITGTVVDGMVARVMAQRELDFLTAQLGVHQDLPSDIATYATDLPYVAFAARQGAPQTSMGRLVARNRQILLDLERVTRSRWMRYRLDAPAGQDVRPIDVDQMGSSPDPVANPLGLKPQRGFPSTGQPQAPRGRELPPGRGGPSPKGPPGKGPPGKGPPRR